MSRGDVSPPPRHAVDRRDRPRLRRLGRALIVVSMLVLIGAVCLPMLGVFRGVGVQPQTLDMRVKRDTYALTAPTTASTQSVVAPKASAKPKSSLAPPAKSKAPAAKVKPKPKATQSRLMVVRVSALNVRRAPNTQAAPVRKLIRGAKVRVTGSVVGEDPQHDGRNRWSRLHDGRWVWSAGLREATKADLAKPKAKATAKRVSRVSASTGRIDRSPAASKAYARSLVLQRWGKTREWSCLNKLWERESNWNYRADNPSSSAYGIPQSLPGSKMKAFGSDWRTNPRTQINWGIDYIDDRYGTPCKAWAHSEAKNWY